MTFTSFGSTANDTLSVHHHNPAMFQLGMFPEKILLGKVKTLLGNFLQAAEQTSVDYRQDVKLRLQKLYYAWKALTLLPPIP